MKCLIFVFLFCALEAAIFDSVGLLSTFSYLLGRDTDFPYAPKDQQIPIAPNAIVFDSNFFGTPADNVQITCSNRQLTLNVSSSNASSLNFFTFEKETYFLVHGFLDNCEVLAANKVGLLVPGRAALLNYTSANVCQVWWRHWSSYDYVTSSTVFPVKVAEYVANFLKLLVGQNLLDVRKVHLVGHSLGAHICGIIGKRFNGTIAEITGIDPAGPGFCFPLEWIPEDQRLAPSDAVYVQTLLTSPGVLGCLEPLGKGNFYANLGILMEPGCAFLDVTCDHCVGPQYWVEAVNPQVIFEGVECANRSDAEFGTCNYSITDQLGIYAKGIPGNFFFRTTKNYPASPFPLQ